MDDSMFKEDSPLITNSSEVALKQPSNIFDPRKKFYRYFGLIFISFLTFGPYFCYVLPGALEKEIERDLKVTTTQFTVFTSLYSWPNVVLCFFGGYLIDRILGIRLGGIVFSCLITIGQFIFGYGAYIKNIYLMDVGRFIFGLGGESVAVAQKAYSVIWFKPNELNLVFGFLTSSALLGASINQISMTPIYNYVEKFKTGYECLGASIMLAGLTCVVSTLCAFILWPLDKRRTRFDKLNSDKENKSKDEIPVIRLTDAIHFPIQLWLIILICVVFYSATFPFISLGKLFFIRKYGFSPNMASLQQSLFFFITVVTSPLFGILVDYTGYNMLWVIVSIAVGIFSHCLLMFSFLNSFIPVLLLGMALSLLATSLWPMVSLIVPKHQLGTAYGLMQSIQNLGLAVFSLLTGYLVQYHGYFSLELFFLGLCIVGFIAAVSLYFIDKLRGGKLCASKKEINLFVNS